MHRRKFIQAGGLSALAFGMPVKKLETWWTSPGKLPSFGVQLYSVKEDMALDPKGTIRKMAEDGYDYIESFEGKQGMFWGMTNREFKQYCDSLHLQVLASHCDETKDIERKAAEAGQIGMKYLISAWKGPQKSIDDFKRIAEGFNKAGEICRKNGIRFAYHNHDYPFRPVDGQLPMDVMLKNTDPELVDFEMDIYWVVTGGKDPKEYLRDYSGRFRLCHVKDRLAVPLPGNANSSCDLGKGIIDFPSVLRVAADHGMKYYVVEQEYFPGSTPLLSAAADAVYMKKFRLA